MGELFKFEMGATVKDRLTGFAGVVIARANYLYGGSRYEVQARALDDGKMIGGQWIDSGRLELVNATVFTA